MTNLSSDLRNDLSSRFSLMTTTPASTTGETDGTMKLLVTLQDGEQVEEVLIPSVSPGHRAVCVSSQVGCKYRCSFCASGQSGLTRNLTTGEMIEQVLLAANTFQAMPTHVVFMGIGEPMDNYDAVLRAARIMNDGEGMAIGARRITISTSGVIPGIERLADEGIQLELSVSLHAPNNDLRDELMPINKKYSLQSLIAACEQYTNKTNRIITLEYCMINGVNDSPGHAEELVSLLSGFKCRVNLIPLNPVPEYDETPSTPAAIDSFAQLITRAGINVTVRTSRGSAVDAACGQLRAHHIN